VEEVEMGTAAVPLTWADPLPQWPRRILVTGCSGSGKTTVAAALSRVLGTPHHELDALFHGPAWVPRPTFVADVAAVAASDAWVVEWQYEQVRPLLLGRADLLVWLDLSRARVFSQLLRRTVARRAGRIELWNGNREPPLYTIFTDPEHLVRWAWGSYSRVGPRVHAVLAGPDPPVVVRLGSRRDVKNWLARLRSARA
jgi:adenylate kinase family enzyme